MRNKFDEQLEKLHIELIKMGALCEEAVSTAILALEKNDVKIRTAATINKSNKKELQYRPFGLVP